MAQGGEAARPKAAVGEPLTELGGRRRGEIRSNQTMIEHQEHVGVLGQHYDAGDEHRYCYAGEKQHLLEAGDEHRIDVGDDTRYYAGEKYRVDVGEEVLSDDPSAQAKQSPLAVAGIMAASAAVTGIAGGGTPSPAAAFGLFALLLAGMSLVVVHVRRA